MIAVIGEVKSRRDCNIVDLVCHSHMKLLCGKVLILFLARCHADETHADLMCTEARGLEKVSPRHYTSITNLALQWLEHSEGDLMQVHLIYTGRFLEPQHHIFGLLSAFRSSLGLDESRRVRQTSCFECPWEVRNNLWCIEYKHDLDCDGFDLRHSERRHPSAWWQDCKLAKTRK